MGGESPVRRVFELERARQPEARGTDGAAAFCLNYFEPKSSRRMDWARKGGKAKGDTAAAGCWLDRAPVWITEAAAAGGWGGHR